MALPGDGGPGVSLRAPCPMISLGGLPHQDSEPHPANRPDETAEPFPEAPVCVSSSGPISGASPNLNSPARGVVSFWFQRICFMRLEPSPQWAPGHVYLFSEVMII